MPNINQLIADIQSKYPNITPDQLTKLINAGVNISSLTDTNGISLNSRGININPNANGPSTNIYQSSINGNIQEKIILVIFFIFSFCTSILTEGKIKEEKTLPPFIRDALLPECPGRDVDTINYPILKAFLITK